MCERERGRASEKVVKEKRNIKKAGGRVRENAKRGRKKTEKERDTQVGGER